MILDKVKNTYRKIKCWFGFHNWEYFGYVKKLSYYIHYRICKQCKRIDMQWGDNFLTISLDEVVKLNIDAYLNLTKLIKIVNLQCPVCGYYCLGKGGKGCINKKQMYKDEIERLNKLYR